MDLMISLLVPWLRMSLWLGNAPGVLGESLELSSDDLETFAKLNLVSWVSVRSLCYCGGCDLEGWDWK